MAGTGGRPPGKNRQAVRRQSAAQIAAQVQRTRVMKQKNKKLRDAKKKAEDGEKKAKDGAARKAARRSFFGDVNDQTQPSSADSAAVATAAAYSTVDNATATTTAATNTSTAAKITEQQHTKTNAPPRQKSTPTMSSPLTNELLEFCRSDSLSEEGLRQIIERHKCQPNENNHHVGNYAFFRVACSNDLLVTEGIIRCLLEYFPAAAMATGINGQQPLHCVCRNPNVTPRIIQLLIDAAPDSVSSETNDGSMALHHFCVEKSLDGTAAIEILELLIEKCPEALRHANNKGYLPIHIASGYKSPEFCQVLIEAYPGCKRISNAYGMLPLHRACFRNNIAAVEYLYKLYPDAIHHAATQGRYPILYAMMGLRYRDNQITAVDIVKYLLECDPTVKLQKFEGTESLLRFACCMEYNGSTIDVGIQIIKVIYDAHPEAIEEDCIASDIQSCHERVQTFLNSQLVYARQAKNHRLMTTPGSNGQLPLHTALQNNVRLGSIKLLVKGNPSALRTLENNFALPLHIACQNHESASVVQYLVGLDATTLDAVDRNGNTAIHLACHFARHEIIALLLDKFDAVSVSKRNSHKKLPIDLLWESNEVEDKESVEYTESVFRLLTAYPETVMNIGIQKQPSALGNCSSPNGKKRKFGSE